MTNVSNFLVQLLKHTNNKSTTLEELVKKTNIPLDQSIKLLTRLSEKGLIDHNYELIKLSSSKRIELAIYSISMGTDIEKICSVLHWKEFENFTANILQKNNYLIKHNFRFKASQRRWEIDIIAYNRPIILCIDCKRWRKNWSNSNITRIAQSQDIRTKAFANSLPSLQKKITLKNWKKAIIFPAILSLFPGQMKIKKMIPIIPILSFQNFLAEFIGNTSQLKYYKIKLGPKIDEFN
jgi:Holliday junction resolvase-like predicted endonuclease